MERPEGIEVVILLILFFGCLAGFAWLLSLPWAIQELPKHPKVKKGYSASDEGGIEPMNEEMMGVVRRHLELVKKEKQRSAENPSQRTDRDAP